MNIGSMLVFQPPSTSQHQTSSKMNYEDRVRWVNQIAITVRSFPSVGEVTQCALTWRGSEDPERRRQAETNHWIRSKCILDYLRHHYTNYDRLKEQLLAMGADLRGDECGMLARRANDALYSQLQRRKGFERFLNNDTNIRY